MVAMSEHGDRINRLENRVIDLTKSTSELQGAYQQLATKDDVSKATLKTVIWIVGVGITSLATLLSALINILSRLPN